MRATSAPYAWKSRACPHRGSALHVPMKSTAEAIGVHCIGHRTALRFLEGESARGLSPTVAHSFHSGVPSGAWPCTSTLGSVVRAQLKKVTVASPWLSSVSRGFQ